MPFRATIGGTRTNGAAATSPGMPASPSGSAAKTDRSGRDDAPRPGGIELPRISLPSGGGAIRGVDEKLTTGQPSGTATLAVPVYVSQGRQGAAPALTLRYDSGTGNGPFGIGWTLTVPAITRKTAKNLPRYMDADDSDVFILAGAEDLVPALAQTLSGTWIADTSDAGGTAYSIRRYRPRAESAFARIERWQENASGDVHWRTVTKDNVTSLYGLSIASRIADPADSSRVFSWLVDLSYDDRGNAISYGYKAEDAANVPVAAHEAGRWVGANRYLKTVSYGNDTPYLPPPGDPPGAGLPDQWDFLLVVDYGEHDQAAPRPSEAVTWPCRPDPFSTYRSGFEVRTYRLGRRFLMFHEFPELSADPVLVRSTDLAYSTSADPTAGLPVYSLLSSVTRTGWYRPAGQPDYETKQLPPLRLGYSGFALGTEVQTADPASLENVTGDSGKGGSTWVDLDYLTGKFTSQQLYSWLVSFGGCQWPPPT